MRWKEDQREVTHFYKNEIFRAWDALSGAQLIWEKEKALPSLVPFSPWNNAPINGQARGFRLWDHLNVAGSSDKELRQFYGPWSPGEEEGEGLGLESTEY